MNLKEIMPSLVILLCFSGILCGGSLVLASMAETKTTEENQKIMQMLLPGSVSFEAENYEGEDANITGVFKGENGYVIETTVTGYVDDLVVWTGVDEMGVVTGLTVRDMAETGGLGFKVMEDLNFLNQFIETSGDATIGENVDGITGATVTSKALAKAVNSAAGFVTGADVTSSATEW